MPQSTTASRLASIATLFVTTLSLCPATHAQVKSHSPRVAPSQPPATVLIDTVTKIQSTPKLTTNSTVVNANSSGSGASTIDSKITQITDSTRATATTDTSIVNGGLNAAVNTNASVLNTPKVVQSTGQTNSRVNGGKLGIAATGTVTNTNLSPNGNSANSTVGGFASGQR
jgi:hypothetical protein